MEEACYAFVTCLATGGPWSEQERTTSFAEFMLKTFNTAHVPFRPAEDQDQEFTCAYPARNGSNSLLKASSACDFRSAVETPRTVIAVRAMLFAANLEEVITSPLSDDHVAKFWVAVRAPKGFCIPLQLINDRTSPYRRWPGELRGALPEELLQRIRASVLARISRAQEQNRELMMNKIKRPRTCVGPELHCMEKLVPYLGKEIIFADEAPSTTWTTCGDPVFAPTDISWRGCGCARLESFSKNMSLNCRGLGAFNVAHKTRYDNEAEIWPALLHGMKCKLLCELRSVSVSRSDVLRLRVHEGELGFASLVCRMETFLGGEADAWHANVEDESSTDKLRMLWLIGVDRLESLGNAHSATQSDIRFSSASSSKSSREFRDPQAARDLEEAYRRGSLHVVTSAPRRDYATRIST